MGQDFIQQVRITCNGSWTSQQDATGQRIRDWKVTMVAIDDDEEVPGKLQAMLDFVEYHLHPTFVDPIRGIKDEPYLLHERGWGEFDLHMILHFKNDFAPEEQLVFKLDFKQPQYSVTYPLIFVNVKRSLATFLRSPQTTSPPRIHNNDEAPASPIPQRHPVEDTVVTGQDIDHLHSIHSRRHGTETCKAWDIPDRFDMVELARRLAQLSEPQVARLQAMVKKHQSDTMTISEENDQLTLDLYSLGAFLLKKIWDFTETDSDMDVTPS